MRDTAGSAAAPRARCRNCLLWGSFMLNLPLRFTSLDHLVGAQQYRCWNSDANRSGGLEIYDELEFGWLFDWQIGRLGTAENFIHVGGGASKTGRNTRAIGDETAGLCNLPFRKARWQVGLRCKCHDAGVLTIEHGVRQDNQSASVR